MRFGCARQIVLLVRDHAELEMRRGNLRPIPQTRLERERAQLIVVRLRQPPLRQAQQGGQPQSGALRFQIVIAWMHRRLQRCAGIADVERHALRTRRRNRAKRPVPNLFAEGLGFGGRCRAKLARQDFLARVVLRERGAALLFGGERAHQLPMRFLPPRFQLDLARGVASRRGVLAARFVMCRQRVERFQRLAMQRFAPHEHPFFKRQTIAEEQGL